MTLLSFYVRQELLEFVPNQPARLGDPRFFSVDICQGASIIHVVVKHVLLAKFPLLTLFPLPEAENN